MRNDFNDCQVQYGLLAFSEIEVDNKSMVVWCNISLQFVCVSGILMSEELNSTSKYKPDECN